MVTSEKDAGGDVCERTWTATVIAVRKQLDETREFVFNPAADTGLDDGDEMIVLGRPEQVAKLRRIARA